MKALRGILKFGGWISLGLFVILSTAFLVIWTFPGVVINTAMLKRVQPHLPKSVEIHYRDVDLSAKSLSFFRKQVHLKSDGLCWKYAGEGIENCFGGADITAEIDIKGWFPKYRLGPVALSDGMFHMQPPPSKPEEKKPDEKSHGFLPTPPEFLRKVELGDVKIEVKDFAYLAPDLKIAGKAKLGAVGGDKQSQWDLVADTDVTAGKDVYRGTADIHLRSVRSQWFGPYVGTGEVKGVLPGKKQVTVDFRGRPLSGDEIAYRLAGEFRDGKRLVQVEANGKGGTLGVSGSVAGRATGLVEHLSDVSIQSCPFGYRKASEKAKIANAHLDCAIQIGTSFPNKQRTVYNTYLKKLSLRLKAQADIPQDDDKKQEARGKIEVLMDPLLAQVENGKGSLTTDFHGRFDEFPKNLDVDTKLQLDVPEFHRVVKMLDGFPWAVPDPFHSLDGEIKLEVSSKGRLNGEIPLPISFITRLKSEQQSFVLDGDGKLTLSDLGPKMKEHLDFKLTLSDVKLVLPYLSLGAPPRFVPDSRIRVPKKNEAPVRATASKEPSNFTYAIQVVTPGQTPLRLVSNLAKNEVPLAIDIQTSSDKPLSGSIRVANFNVELFRRTATVQHFYVHLTPNPDDIEVNGEVQVVYTDYTVRILILGLAKGPDIKFVSDPPLPEKDVIAVLLFGKKIDALDADQSQSVGSTRSAVADSAVSLASMYLLASTPVESVGYDPGSGVFNAKVRLADGTSLTVGSNFNNTNQVGLRRRVGNNLYLNTTYESLVNAAQSATNKLQTLLEWSKGY